MKKIYSILTITLLLFLLIGCSNNQQNNQTTSWVDACKNAAQGFIDSGDIESAIDVLEEGIAVTESEILKNMLSKITEESSNDFEKYVGEWISVGSVILITMNKSDSIDIECKKHFFSFKKSLLLTDIVNNAVQFEVTDDVYGEKYSIDMQFTSEGITCNDVLYTKYEGENSLRDSADTFAVISGYIGEYATENTSWHYGGEVLKISVNGYMMDIEYTKAYAQSEPATVHKTIDITTASDYTISFEFKDNFENTGVMTLHFNPGNGEQCVECEITDLIANPTATLGVAPGKSVLWKDDGALERLNYSLEEYEEWEALGFPKYNVYTGEYEIKTPDYSNIIQNNPKSYTASDYFRETGNTESSFRRSCWDIIYGGSAQSADGTDDIKKYVDHFLDKAYTTSEAICIDSINVVEGVIMYYIDPSYLGNCVILDYRDDVYSPLLNVGDSIRPYMVYGGTSAADDGTEYLLFWMLSVDNIK